ASSSLTVGNGEMILQSGGSFSDTSLNFTSSIFKPSGAVSLTGSSAFNLNETSSIQLQGATQLTQSSGTVYWPSIDLNETELTLNVTEMYCCLYQTGGLTIGAGEKLITGASIFNVDNPLTIESGGILTSGSGNVQINGALTLDGELVQGGGNLNLIGEGAIGVTGKLDIGTGDFNVDSTLTIGSGGTLTSGSGNVQIGGALTLDGELVQGGGNLNLIGEGAIGVTGKLDIGAGDFNVDSTLTIGSGGTLTSGSGNVQIGGALTLDGELVQGGGTLNLIGGGGVGATGKLDMSGAELALGGALNITGTLAANSSSSWSGWQGTLDLSSGTLESSGGIINLNDFTTSANTTLKLSGDTEISNSNDITFGTLELAGNKLTLGGSGGLILPNTLTMAAGSEIETKGNKLTHANPLQLNSGAITSTGGTLSFAGGLTLGAQGTLDVTDSTLSTGGNLELSAGTFTTSNDSELNLSAATTLSTSSMVTFENIIFGLNALNLGTESTHIKLCPSGKTRTYPQTTFNTGPGSLTMTCELRMSNLSQWSSTGGTITLESGGYVPMTSIFSIPNTTIVLGGDLRVFGSTSKLYLNNSTLNTNGNSVQILTNLEVEGNQDLSGVDLDVGSIFSLAGDATVNSSDNLSVGTLDLAEFALTLNDQMAGLNVSQALTLDAATEQIITGDADLSLNGGVTVNAGTLSSTGGTLSASSFSVGAAGTVNIQGGTLTLPAGGTAVTGAAFTTSDTTISLGGTLEVANSWTSTNTNLSLTADTTLTSANPISIKTVDMGTHFLALGSDTSDLTIADGFTINYSGENGINTGLADLTLNGPVNVSVGGIFSSGGTVTFGAGAGATSFADEMSGMLLKDTTLDLQTDLSVSWLELSGASSLLSTNGNTLNISDGLDIGGGPELDFTNINTDNETYLNLVGDASITKTGELALRQTDLRGYTLTLNQDLTSLTANKIHFPDFNENSPNYMANTGKFKAQGVHVTLKKMMYLNTGTMELGDNGILTLEQGGYLQENGVLDLSNSTLELSGPFYNYEGVGTLTTSASTLRLNSNIKFEPGNNAAFDTYEPNGWGMVLNNNSQDPSEAINLTLGTNGEDLILDPTLSPNTDSLTSGFVNSYQDGEEFDTNSYGIGIISSHGIGLTINGNLILKNDAQVSTFENISIANLNLESGSVEVNDSSGNLSIGGGNIGANGELIVGGQATLNL
ncbi:MAG: hypothetical protein QF535_01790, partial [Anaerolineales bacterium]|nr:hypothetical protein [Anaerolineales bacterium]